MKPLWTLSERASGVQQHMQVSAVCSNTQSVARTPALAYRRFTADTILFGQPDCGTPRCLQRQRCYVAQDVGTL